MTSEAPPLNCGTGINFNSSFFPSSSSGVNETTLVHKTGSETVGGNKTFSGATLFSNSVNVTGGVSIDGVLIDSTAAELNTLAGVTQGTVDPSKALVSNSTKGIVSIADIRFDNLGTTSTGLTANSTLDRANPGLRVYGPGDYFYNTGTLGMTRNGIILEGAQYGNVGVSIRGGGGDEHFFCQ